MNRFRAKKLLKFRTKSTTDLSTWNKNDEKLLKAVENSDLKKVNSILSKKTLVPNKLGPRGHSVFQIACASGTVEIVDSLLKHTDDVNDLTIQGNTALQLAAAKGHTGVVQLLLQANADVDMKDSNNMTALHHACAGLHFHCVQALLHGHADPMATEKTGKTSLFYASHRGDINICKLLVDRGADVNTQDTYQVTSLMIAAKEGHRDVCEFLLRAGANPQIQDKEGKIALIYAVNGGHGYLREVFANAPARKWDVPVFNEREICYPEHINNKNKPPSSSSRPTDETDNTQKDIKVDLVSQFRQSPTTEDKLPVEQKKSDHDDTEDMLAEMKRTSSAPNLLNVDQPESPRNGQSNLSKKLQELQEEHDQLNEEYHKLLLDNSKLQSSSKLTQQTLQQQQQTLQQQQQEQNQGKDIVSEEMKLEINNLKQLLQDEKDRNEDLNRIIEENKKTQPLMKKLGDDGWPESDNDDIGDHKKIEDKKTVILLRSQIATLNKENEELKEKLQQIPNGHVELDESTRILDSISTGISLQDLEQLNDKIQSLETEKQDLKTEIFELKETMEMDKLNSAITEEELNNQNKTLEEKLNALESMRSETLPENDEKTTELKEQNQKLMNDYEHLKSELETVKSKESKSTEEVQKSEEQIKKSAEEIQLLKTLLEQAQLSNQVLNSSNSSLKEVLGKNSSNKGEDEGEDHLELVEELTSLRQEVIMLKSVAPSSRTESDDSGEVESKVKQDMDEDEKNTIEMLEDENEKLQDQVTVLSTELNKLRQTFDAILKAGDDLQEDFDQVQQEKERTQEAYEKMIEERDEFSKENNYLLQDGNQMHEDLTKLVYELENLQEKYKTLASEKKDLEIKVSAVSLAGKVGEVATLLEEKEKLKLKYDELEDTSSTLQHDHDIVLEEVQSLQEQISHLTTQRDQMFEEMDEYEGVIQQHEMLQQDYNQLEQDYTDLLKDKEKLEAELEDKASETTGEEMSNNYAISKLEEENKTLQFDKEQLDLTIDELSKANALLEEEIVMMKKITPDVSNETKLNNNDSIQIIEHDKQIQSLQSQLNSLQKQLEENNKHHEEAVIMYRTHLISAVQGHMDPDVNQALNNIIEIRSMEQFC